EHSPRRGLPASPLSPLAVKRRAGRAGRRRALRLHVPLRSARHAARQPPPPRRPLSEQHLLGEELQQRRRSLPRVGKGRPYRASRAVPRRCPSKRAGVAGRLIWSAARPRSAAFQAAWTGGCQPPVVNHRRPHFTTLVECRPRGRSFGLTDRLVVLPSNPPNPPLPRVPRPRPCRL